MDAIQPIGAMIQPPQQQNPLNAYSTLLGIQQQKLGIQQQQQALQGQAAQVSQEQQKNSELQKAQQVGQAAAQGKYNNPDGSLDRVRMSQDLSAIGPYAQAMAGNILSQANEVVQNKQAIQNLTVSRKAEIGSTIQSLIQDPDLDHSKLINEIERLRSQHPNDPEFSRLLTSTTAMIVGRDDSPDQLRSKLGQMYGALTGQQQSAPGTLDTGGQIVPGATNRFTGKFTPAQAGVNKTLSPQVISPPGGIPIQVGGGAGGPSGAAGAPGGGRNMSGFAGPQPTDQEMKDFGDYQARLNNRVQTASNLVPRIQKAEQALDEIQGGAGAERRAKIAQGLQAVGAPKDLVDAVAGGNLGAAQAAEKLLFQTTFSGLRQSMEGDSSRVAEWQAAAQVFPSISTDPRARKDMLGFMVDQANKDYAEQQAMAGARNKGTLSPATWQADYQKQLRAGQVQGTPASQIPGRTITRRGTTKDGRRVVQYSDGSIEHAAD